MSGGSYEPHDSRNVTLRPNQPGKPAGWREAAGEGAPSDDLAPLDQREVHGNAPADDTRWTPDADDADIAVRQERPFSAEEAAGEPTPAPRDR